MKRKPNLIILLFLLTMVYTCNRTECQTSNPIFLNNEPHTQVYKAELAKEFNRTDPSKLDYWLQQYHEQDGQDYLYVHIQGQGICAIMHLTMTHWTNLESLKAKKGASYQGAQFKNLSFDIQQDTVSTTFIYKSVGNIID